MGIFRRLYTLRLHTCIVYFRRVLPMSRVKATLKIWILSITYYEKENNKKQALVV